MWCLCAIASQARKLVFSFFVCVFCLFVVVVVCLLLIWGGSHGWPTTLGVLFHILNDGNN